LKYQSNDYTCGIYAVFNLLKLMNIRATIKSIAKFTGTTPERGTNEFGIMNALTNFGIETGVVHCLPKDLPLDIPVPMIICTNNLNHWVVVVCKIGKNYLIIDSNNTRQNKNENGAYVLNRKNLLKKWRNSENVCYGISCTRF